MLKKRDNTAPAKIYYADVWGSREKKYKILSETDIQTTEWSEVLQLYIPVTTVFVPQQIVRPDQACNIQATGWQVKDIFQESSIGILTARDKLTIHWTAEQVHETITDFVSLSEGEAREKYGLRERYPRLEGPPCPSRPP